MERYAAGDEAAFEMLFERYERRAYGFFLKRTGSPERSQDLYQEVFLRIHRARQRYDSSRLFAPWFFQIASRLLVDDHRRAFRRHEAALGQWEPGGEDPGGETILAGREEAAWLLGLLSPEERYVVFSAKVGEVGYAELARRLGKSAEAVKKMASRAMQRLRAAGPPVPARSCHSAGCPRVAEGIGRRRDRTVIRNITSQPEGRGRGEPE